MKTMSNKQIETGFENLKKEFEIEIKLYQGTATIEDVDFIESLIVGELPAPRSQYLLGLSYYLGVGREYNPEKGNELFSEVKRRGNQIVLISLSHAYAFIGDEYADDSIWCLEKAAKLGSKFAKGMLREMKRHPFKFPEA